MCEPAPATLIIDQAGKGQLQKRTTDIFLVLFWRINAVKKKRSVIRVIFRTLTPDCDFLAMHAGQVFF